MGVQAVVAGWRGLASVRLCQAAGKPQPPAPSRLRLRMETPAALDRAAVWTGMLSRQQAVSNARAAFAAAASAAQSMSQGSCRPLSCVRQLAVLYRTLAIGLRGMGAGDPAAFIKKAPDRPPAYTQASGGPKAAEEEDLARMN